LVLKNYIIDLNESLINNESKLNDIADK